ncbi:hypothetical protein LTR08_002327 [Meristemomyces frigidus]|nr:hypothetical protein LTR08_002327 [Meristemomyces frigidus]
MASITLRPPSSSAAKAPLEYQSPNITWLTECWHVTHSTLPMWKNKRNVRIQYTPLEPSSASILKENTDRLDDLVTYQSVKSEKVQTVKGIDTCASQGDVRGEWDWRGKGWLKIASSHWEVMGWGEESNTGNKWVVTEFAKTLFTPAGIDIYSKDRRGLTQETLKGIKLALTEVNDDNVKKMAGQLFEVTVDDA